MKILWVGDGVVPTGFSTVSTNILTRLHGKHKYDIGHLALCYGGDPHPFPWRIYPASAHGANMLGFERLAEIYNRERPDLVCLLGDSWVIPLYLEQLPKNAKVMAYIPVDAPNQWCGRKLNRLNMLVAYTRFGGQELRKGGYTGPLRVVPHGINRDQFYPVSKDEARKELNFPPEWRDRFIVSNVNRNQPRKRLDLTIQYFAEWWHEAGKPNAGLMLHCALEDAGWNVLDLATYYGIDDIFMVTGVKSVNQPGAFCSTERLNLLYNAADVNLSTSIGEGWGLTTFESMATGTANIVPGHSAYNEWAAGYAYHTLAAEIEVTCAGINTIGRVPDRLSTKAAIAEMSEPMTGYRSTYERLALECVSKPEYSWDSVGDRFAEIMEVIVNG